MLQSATPIRNQTRRRAYAGQPIGEVWRRLGDVHLRGRGELMERGREQQRAIRLLERKNPQYAQVPLRGRPVMKIAGERAVSWADWRPSSAEV